MLRRLRKWVWRWTVRMVLAVLLASVGWVLLYRWLDPPLTLLMHQARDEAGEYDYRWQDREAISPHLQLAVIAAEDQRFRDHYGFDTEAIEEAWEANAEGKRVRGASTISQQTAKNAFLWPARSWLRKGVEVWFTFWMELLWPKARILEVYLNVAEFGPGVYGAEAAAQHYFQRAASDLSRPQAALLAAILPAPRRFTPPRITDYQRQRQAWILQQMNNLGPAYLDFE